MAKLKFNIKNLQLAGALKSHAAPLSEEEPAPLIKQSSSSAVEPKKRQTRLREDAQTASTLKQAERTLAAREKEVSKDLKEELPKKRKTRLIQATQEASQEEGAATLEPSLETPIVSESLKEEISSLEEKTSSSVVKETPPATPNPSSEKSPTTQAPPRPSFTPSHESAPSATVIKKIPPKDLRPKKKEEIRTFDARDRQGLRDIDNEAWRKRRAYKPAKRVQEEFIVRPKFLKIPLPITIKDLAQEMKLKASQLISKLLMQGMTLTLNDSLDDETVVQLLGHEFGCEITIDTQEQERIRITGQTIKQEIEKTISEQLALRPPVVAFMGHVDHGKTSLIDAIRKSNRAAGEAGAITQHIGAFKVHTQAGDVTILDTPGHEAFFEMRSRGANVTDIVILVIAGDEGIRAQTEEAIKQAREAGVPILVALNKCDKPNFDAQKVYRQLADVELLPESWGGTTITVSCSALTGEGMKELLEMIALQAEVLELRANPQSRARGTVLESEMHKGLGAVATVLVQNGTLHFGDAIVFGHFFGRIKTMQDEYGRSVEKAGPSDAVKITGLSQLALAGHEFIVVKNEKEAKDLAEARAEGAKRDLVGAQSKLSSLEKMMAKKESGEMKILPIVLRADVQGSLEALKTSLSKIASKKVRLEIVGADIGEISESDIELAAASKATIVGFHTRIESHADDMIKQKAVSVITHDVIYHLLDDVKLKMKSLLDKLEREDTIGEVLVKAVFKSSQLGLIAGCQVTEGVVKRQSLARQIRGKETIWKGKIGSLKRLKEDVKEAQKGFECGILLEGQADVREGDRLEIYEITYLEQDL